jgi:tRNA A37 threonylcarbamoyltransferase TsaD
VPRLLLGGGVIANRRLREVALARARPKRESPCASRR